MINEHGLRTEHEGTLHSLYFSYVDYDLLAIVVVVLVDEVFQLLKQYC